MKQVAEQRHHRSRPCCCLDWKIQQRATLGSPVGLILWIAGTLFLVAAQSTTVRAEGGNLSEPADTSSPQATLRSFLDSGNELYQKFQQDRYAERNSIEIRALAHRMLDCLDVSELPEFSREDYTSEAAVCLKEILDRIPLPPYSLVPDTKQVESAGDPQKFSRWKIPGSRLTIGRVEEGPRRHEYLFTSGTVERVIEYYEDLKSLPYRITGPDTSPGFYRWYMSAPKSPLIAALVARLPDSAKEPFLGLTAWKWPGLILALVLACVLMVGLYWLQKKSVQRARGKHWVRYGLTIVYPVAAMLIPLAFGYVAKEFISIRGTPLYLLTFCANVTALLAAQVVVFGTSNRVAEAMIASPQIHPGGLDAQLIRVVSKLLSLLVAVILFLVGGQYLGIHLTTLLASAGVGGFAVALAAQDTLKNLFGTLMLMTDKPFRIGERIVFKTYDGVVEDIGLRSTRIRLLTGHQVTIPNDELARIDIENVGRRPHIRRVANLHLPLNTPREKIEQAVAIIRTALQEHEGMPPEYPPRVYFNEFNRESFNIRMIYWYSPPNYWDFIAFGEQLNVEICRAFEAEGICFSLPLRITPTSLESQEKPFEVQVMENQ